MAKKALIIHGITVDMRDKKELIEIIEGMLEDNAASYKKAKMNVKKRSIKSSLSFFASVVEHLKTSPTININIAKLVDKMDVSTFAHADAKEQITKILLDVVKDAGAALDQ